MYYFGITSMNHIKALREKTGLSQEGFGALLGLSQGAIGHYENNRRTPGLDECRAIVRAFNEQGLAVTLDDVFPPKEKQAA